MPYLFLLLVVLAIGAAVYSWHVESKRTEALAELARILQWRFDPERSANDAAYAEFEIFRRGFDRLAFNTLTGELDLDDWRLQCRAGDYRFKTKEGSGKSRRTVTHKFSYLILHLPFDTPALLVRPEGVFDKMAAAFGFDDIDFESAEFSRRFFVKSDDKRFAYDLMHPRMMEFLLAETPPMLDVEGGKLCLSDGKQRWQPDTFHRQIAFVRRFLKQWPKHLVKTMEAQ